MHRQAFALSVGFFGWACAGSALADEAADKAAADALFQQARELVNSGAVAEACPKFAASQKLDPRPGRLLALGDCYEQAGATASAWATFREAERAASQAKNDAKAVRQRAEAEARAQALEPNLSKLVIEVDPSARVEALSIKRNGKEVDEAAWSVEVPVDPGMQEVEASAKGRKTWAEKVKVEGKGTVRVKVPVLEVVVEQKEVREGGTGQGSGKSIAVMAVGGGLGVVGVGVGVGLVFASSGAKDSAVKLENDIDQAGGDGACSPSDSRYPAFKSQCSELSSNLKNADLYRTLGIGSLVVGGLFAIGTIVYAAMPSKKRATAGLMVMPTVSPTFAGVGAFGHF